MRALFVQHDAHYGGSPISGRMVVEGLLRAGWKTDVAFAADGPLAGSYAEMGCTVHILPHGTWLRGGGLLRKAKRLGRDALAAARFLKLMHRLKPDLVYVNTITGIAAIVAARLLRIPAVWHIRELFDDVGGEMQAPLGGKALARWAVARLPSRVVVISQAVADNVLAGRKSPRVEIVPNAVSARFFDEQRSVAECRALFRLPAGVPLIGVPGTLRPVKGHGFFLDAATRVLREIPDCHVAIMGDGPRDYRTELESQVEKAKLADRVWFLGTVADAAAFYRACDVICVPSRSESFGRTVIEAFACGTPVVGSAVGGICETVDHDKTGLLVAYGDVESLSAALLGLLGDRPAALRLATAARAKAIACYREGIYQERILGIVNEVVRK